MVVDCHPADAGIPRTRNLLAMTNGSARLPGMSLSNAVPALQTIYLRFIRSCNSLFLGMIR